MSDLRRRALVPVLALSWMALALASARAAESPLQIPTQDDAIVEHLPTHFGDAAQRRQARAAERARRDELRRHPDELALALETARAAIARGRDQGDPRELGSAEAALAPWWPLADPPPAVRLLRATIRQSQHDFDAAQVDLDALLAAGPAVPLELRAQALLTRSAIDQVRGRYPQALAGCRHLGGPDFAGLGGGVQLSAQACAAELASLQGHADIAAATLARLAGADDSDTGATDTTPAWLTLMRAELAERRGDPQAGALFLQTLRAHTDVYTLCAYADWLLDQHRPAEVVTLLRGREAADPVLLRLALAYRQLHSRRHPLTVQATNTLGERFDAALLRGDRSHGREQSRFELDLRDNPRAALALAQRNWTVQREPADALVLVRAARAAHNPAAAAAVWQFLRDHGGSDARLGPPPGGGNAG